MTVSDNTMIALHTCFASFPVLPRFFLCLLQTFYFFLRQAGGLDYLSDRKPLGQKVSGDF